MVDHLLSFIVFLPLLGAVFVILAPKKIASGPKTAFTVSLGIAVVTFLLSCFLVSQFDRNQSSLQFVEKQGWINSLSISYFLGVDGISIFFIPLTTLIFLLSIISSHFFAEKLKGSKGYYALILFLESCILGVFSAQDMFLFFMFWTASLLPGYFLVGIWGGKNKESASTAFFTYQLFGCALFLFALLAIYYLREPHQFDLVALSGGKFSEIKFNFYDRELKLDNLIFLILFVGLAVRIPVIPFHGWFTKFITETPPALTAVMSTVFLKTGCYALIRLNYSLFPDSVNKFAELICVVGVINIIYGALCAINQNDIRKLVAYGSLSHMGFILLGIGTLNIMSFQGALVSLVSQTFYISLLFFLIGVIGNRTNEFLIFDQDGKGNFGSLVMRAPVLSGFFVIAIFSAIGFPGLGAFVSQILILLGAFPVHLTLTILGLVGVLITAGFFLGLYKNIFWGNQGKYSEMVTDIRMGENFFLVPLVLLCLLIGVYPSPMLKISQATVQSFLHAIVGETNDHS